MHTQEEILLKLIQGKFSNEWANAKTTQGWNTQSNNTVDACQWDGISCDPIDGSVTQIAMPRKVQLEGTIPEEFRELTDLIKLDLSSVSMTMCMYVFFVMCYMARLFALRLFLFLAHTYYISPFNDNNSTNLLVPFQALCPIFPFLNISISERTTSSEPFLFLVPTASCIWM